MLQEILRVEDLSKQYNGQQVLDGISLSVHAGQKIALVGENGTGKSTLARIVAGAEAPDAGSRRLAADTVVGWLPQEIIADDSVTLEAYIAGISGDLLALETRLRQMEQDLSTPEKLKIYGSLQAAFAERGGYDLVMRIPVVLGGLGLNHLPMNTPLKALSGGEKTGAHLAALLLQQPALLILDEPTNHLDFAGVAWLESYLAQYPGACLMLTHDRMFIERVATLIAELSATTHRLTLYHGSFTDYLRQKEYAYQQSLEAFLDQREEIARLRRLMKTTVHNPRKAKIIQDGDKFQRGYMKQQAETTRSKAVRDAAQRLEVLERSPLNNPGRLWRIAFPFDPLPLTSAQPLRLDDVTFGWEDRVVLRGVNAQVGRGDRVVLMAPNGAGKTTLLRIAAGLLQPQHGAVVWSPQVALGYLDQEGETLMTAQRVPDAYRQATGSHDTDADITTVLHRSGLFSDGSLAYKTIAMLSVGQRRKLGIAILIGARANLLLLDEPTNHLDLASLEAFEDALVRFPGSVLSVSHDRRYARRVATHVWRLENGCLRVE
jgi:macrolide transport system ATP-binding/permease protein